MLRFEFFYSQKAFCSISSRLMAVAYCIFLTLLSSILIMIIIHFIFISVSVASNIIRPYFVLKVLYQPTI